VLAVWRLDRAAAGVHFAIVSGSANTMAGEFPCDEPCYEMLYLVTLLHSISPYALSHSNLSKVESMGACTPFVLPFNQYMNYGIQSSLIHIFCTNFAFVELML